MPATNEESSSTRIRASVPMLINTDHCHPDQTCSRTARVEPLSDAEHAQGRHAAPAIAPRRSRPTSAAPGPARHKPCRRGQRRHQPARRGGGPTPSLPRGWAHGRDTRARAGSRQIWNAEGNECIRTRASMTPEQDQESCKACSDTVPNNRGYARAMLEHASNANEVTGMLLVLLTGIIIKVGKRSNT